MPTRNESLSEFTIKIMQSTHFSSSKVISILKKFLHSRERNERKIASVCILNLSQKSKKFFKKLKSENLVKRTGDLITISLNEIGLVKKTSHLKSLLKNLENVNCGISDRFYFKHSLLDHKITEVLSLTEINFYLKNLNFEIFPDPKKSIIWTYCPDEDTEEGSLSQERSEKKIRNFRVQKRSNSLACSSTEHRTPRFGWSDTRNKFRIKARRSSSMKLKKKKFPKQILKNKNAKKYSEQFLKKIKIFSLMKKKTNPILNPFQQLRQWNLKIVMIYSVSESKI